MVKSNRLCERKLFIQFCCRTCLLAGGVLLPAEGRDPLSIHSFTFLQTVSQSLIQGRCPAPDSFISPGVKSFCISAPKPASGTVSLLNLQDQSRKERRLASHITLLPVLFWGSVVNLPGPASKPWAILTSSRALLVTVFSLCLQEAHGLNDHLSPMQSLLRRGHRRHSGATQKIPRWPSNSSKQNVKPAHALEVTFALNFFDLVFLHIVLLLFDNSAFALSPPPSPVDTRNDKTSSIFQGQDWVSLPYVNPLPVTSAVATRTGLWSRTWLQRALQGAGKQCAAPRGGQGHDATAVHHKHALTRVVRARQ
ncbi:LOW QUALITY PROTEIN: Proprotein convertase subtilisin/kexin type 6 [Plecturocebus cupreus]